MKFPKKKDLQQIEPNNSSSYIDFIDFMNLYKKCTSKPEKVPALSFGKIEKYVYLTGKEILPSDQRRMIKQAKSTYSSLGKAFDNLMKKTIENLWRKQIHAIMNQKEKKEALISNHDILSLNKKERTEIFINLLKKDLKKKHNQPVRKDLMIQSIITKTLVGRQKKRFKNFDNTIKNSKK